MTKEGTKSGLALRPWLRVEALQEICHLGKLRPQRIPRRVPNRLRSEVTRPLGATQRPPGTQKGDRRGLSAPEQKRQIPRIYQNKTEFIS